MYTEVKCLRNIVACRRPVLSTLLVSWACFFTAQVKYFGCFFCLVHTEVRELHFVYGNGATLCLAIT